MGIGDAKNNEIVEMLTTVSAELGADTHNVVIADDLTAIIDERERRLAIQHLVRTLHAVEQPPYLVLMADELGTPASQSAVTALLLLNRLRQHHYETNSRTKRSSCGPR